MPKSLLDLEGAAVIFDELQHSIALGVTVIAVRDRFNREAAQIDLVVTE
jgi:hypothetical protein